MLQHIIPVACYYIRLYPEGNYAKIQKIMKKKKRSLGETIFFQKRQHRAF